MAFIIGIEGAYGAGKTLTASIKAHQWRNATGAEIFANYELRDAYLFEHYTDWYRVAHVHGSIIVFDESQKDWDSRRFSGSSQIDKTHIMNYVRKMNSVFVFVLPDFSDVDARVRKMCEILIHVERKRNGTMMNYIFDYTDKRFGDYGRLIKKEYVTWEKQKEIFKLNLYNTKQMVQSFPMPGKNEVQEFFRTLEAYHQAAVRRVDPHAKPIQVKLKEELELPDLFNPNHAEEVLDELIRESESISLSAGEGRRKDRRRSQPIRESILI